MEEIRSPTKPCPFCAEVIPADAIYCRYCHKDLAPKPARLMGWKQLILSLVIGLGLGYFASLPYVNNPAQMVDAFITDTIIWSVIAALVIWLIRYVTRQRQKPPDL